MSEYDCPACAGGSSDEGCWVCGGSRDAPVILPCGHPIGCYDSNDPVDGCSWCREIKKSQRQVDELKATCTCGSGGHPRPCKAHPKAFDNHILEIDYETLREEYEILETKALALCQRIAELEGLNRPIPVGEREVPRDGEYVMIFLEKFGWGGGFFKDGKWPSKSITHWRRWPERPEKPEEEEPPADRCGLFEAGLPSGDCQSDGHCQCRGCRRFIGEDAWVALGNG